MKIIIYGLGKQAELTHYLLTHDSPYEVAGFCVDQAYFENAKGLYGLPLVSADNLQEFFPPNAYKLHLAIGNNNIREQVFLKTRAWGYSFVNYISSRSNIWNDLIIGENVFFDPGSGAHPFVSIGSNNIIVNTNIGHHAVFGSNILASCALVGAKSEIGDNTYLGMNCVIREGVKIGRNNLIGAGTYISSDTEDNAVFSAPKTIKRSMHANKVSFFNS